MKLSRIYVFGILMTLFVISLVGCAPKATPAPTEPAGPAPTEPAAPTEPMAGGGTLVIAMNLNDVVTLDPAFAGETTNLFIHINTYDTLVDIRPDDLSTVVPRLAERWEVNPEFTEFTFYLRKDVKFAWAIPSPPKMWSFRGIA